MDKHIHSLKNFINSLASDDERERFASICGTTLGHLRQIYYRNRSCDAALAIEIEKNSCRSVECEDLRPDVDFQYLRESLEKPPQPTEPEEA